MINILSNMITEFNSSLINYNVITHLLYVLSYVALNNILLFHLIKNTNYSQYMYTGLLKRSLA